MTNGVTTVKIVKLKKMIQHHSKCLMFMCLSLQKSVSPLSPNTESFYCESFVVTTSGVAHRLEVLSLPVTVTKQHCHIICQDAQSWQP